MLRKPQTILIGTIWVSARVVMVNLVAYCAGGIKQEFGVVSDNEQMIFIYFHHPGSVFGSWVVCFSCESVLAEDRVIKWGLLLYLMF